MLDPQEVLKEKCAEIPKCSKLKEEFDNCEERVNSKSKTTETCEQELLDFLQCVDSCVSVWENVWHARSRVIVSLFLCLQVSKNLFDHLK